MKNGCIRLCGRVFALILLIVIVMGLSPAALALAHAVLARSEPAAGSILAQSPDRVSIWFTEAVDQRLSQITVLDARGKQVDNGDSAGYQNDATAISVTLPKLPDGTYAVYWKSFASDGHSASGTFVFSVGVSQASASSLVQPGPTQPKTQRLSEIVMRWLGLLSILTLAGCLVFELFITRPILAAKGAGWDMRDMGLGMEALALNVVWLAAILFLIASIGELVVTASIANNIPWSHVWGSPIVTVIQSSWGRVWLWREIFAVTILIALLTASLETVKEYAGLRAWQIVALIFAAGTLFMTSLASHAAATTEVRAAAIFADYLHLLAASVWVGGVFYFALVVPPAMKAKRKEIESQWAEDGTVPGERLFWPQIHSTAISRFSILALLSVGTLVITGLYNAWAQVTELRALTTPYGVMLITKLGFAAPLVLLGAVNLLYVRPRLRHDTKALKVFRKAVTAESVLSIVVLLVVGILVGIPPARQTASQSGSVIVLSPPTGNLLWGVELLFIGLLFGGVTVTLGRWWTRARILFISIGAVSAIIGLIMIVITRA